MFLQQRSHRPAPLPRHLAPAEPDGTESDDTLEDAGRDEREYVRERLRRELDRDPTEEEIDDWLRKHTEGY
jgi:hypothetical protein